MASSPTLDQLLHTFEVYNLAIWPTHVVAYLLGAVALSLVIMNTSDSSRIIFAVLSLLWLGQGSCSTRSSRLRSTRLPTYLVGCLTFRGYCVLQRRSIESLFSFREKLVFSGWDFVRSLCDD
jgi:hypothetical protein